MRYGLKIVGVFILGVFMYFALKSRAPSSEQVRETEPEWAMHKRVFVKDPAARDVCYAIVRPGYEVEMMAQVDCAKIPPELLIIVK